MKIHFSDLKSNRIGMWRNPRTRKENKEKSSQQTSLKQQTAAASEIKQTSMNEIWFHFRL